MSGFVYIRSTAARSRDHEYYIGYVDQTSDVINEYLNLCEHNPQAIEHIGDDIPYIYFSLFVDNPKQIDNMIRQSVAYHRIDSQWFNIDLQSLIKIINTIISNIKTQQNIHLTLNETKRETDDNNINFNLIFNSTIDY